MILLPRRCLLALAAVIDVALNARASPVAAKALASRHSLPPRHLETLLQALVRGNILKGVRGPHGGYELARERRRITAGDIVRAALSEADRNEHESEASGVMSKVVEPLADEAGRLALASLDEITLDEMCRRAQGSGVESRMGNADFTI